MLFFSKMLYICNPYSRNNPIRLETQTSAQHFMRSITQTWKTIILGGIILLFSNNAFSEISSEVIPPEDKKDTLVERNSFDTFSSSNSVSFSRRVIHRIGIESRPGYIVPTNVFIKGENMLGKAIKNSLSSHLKYSFQFTPNTYIDRIYGGAYQGIGVAYYSFDDRKELGSPFTFYLFQGARIARFHPRLSLDYEWNFGLSAGWKPYDYNQNSYNRMMGSKVNAYINLNFHFNWILSRYFDFTAGVAMTHFSNGNTKFPNAGLNDIGLKVGLIYNINRNENALTQPSYQPHIPAFPRHISYDWVLFGSWRRKGVIYMDKKVPSPAAYPVLGFNFAPMYNFGYKFRAGISLDGVYDGSANVYTDDNISFHQPSLNKQLALGISGRAEYVMPYFTVNAGLGINVLHGGGDLKAFYQVLALKIELTRSSFLHIGYNLQNFETPNYLMLGIGFRFNNKYPSLHRR